MGTHAGGLFVFVEIRFQGERLAATTAHMRLGVRVRLNVGAQVRLVGEGLVANGALEGFLTWEKDGRVKNVEDL